MDYQTQFAAFFDELANASGAVALRYFRQNLAVDEKEDKSPVTQADREIEKTLRGLINKKFPSHGIIGEEFGSENTGAEFVWVIDPIDGTKAFATGRPTFGTIIGLTHQGKPVVGTIDQPYTKERWFGISNQSCFHNGKPVKVAPPRQLATARFYSTGPYMFEGGYEKNFDTLCRMVKWPQFSCDCYAYGLLALGCIDLMMERLLKVYDVMGAVPLILGAGGYISTWQGKHITLDYDGTMVAATSQQLAQEALAVINLK